MSLRTHSSNTVLQNEQFAVHSQAVRNFCSVKLLHHHFWMRSYCAIFTVSWLLQVHPWRTAPFSHWHGFFGGVCLELLNALFSSLPWTLEGITQILLWLRKFQINIYFFLKYIQTTVLHFFLLLLFFVLISHLLAYNKCSVHLCYTPKTSLKCKQIYLSCDI